MLCCVSVFPVSITGHCWRQNIALDEQIICYNMKKHVVYGFTSAFHILKTDYYLAYSSKTNLGYTSVPLFSHSIYLFPYLDF